MTLKVLLTDYLRSCDVFIEMETVGHDPYKKALMWGAFLDIGHCIQGIQNFLHQNGGVTLLTFYMGWNIVRNKIGQFYKIIGPAPLIELLATTWGEIIDNQNFDKKLVY